MSLDEGLTDGQSKTSATRALLAAMACPVEPLEYVRQFVGIDAWSIIRNCYDHCIVWPLSSDMHFALTVHQRIGDQVVEHDLDAPAVYRYFVDEGNALCLLIFSRQMTPDLMKSEIT